MAKRNLNYYLIKIERLTGWFLVPILVTFLCTGYALCGEFGVDRWLDPNQALAVHQFLDLPLLALFLVHATLAANFSFRRWGWIGRRKKSA